ncbi:Chemiosmotic efflux system C protein A [Legionella donaldsonii]|uniref:Chemiosmotic efflux system C protein A n=1 Tax=Legionella donaldsonii TaxID=45060 RepID=A0A378JIT1_9GAMM|nr:transporter [Legionella donaldsonii]STX44580.1 Chemiosmotic efflux system C protein A [Legionella donaldsonii]
MMHSTLKQKKHFWLGLIASVLMVCGYSQVFANPTEEQTEVIPKTIPAIWQAVDKHAASIEKAITDNQLTSIHEHAFAIRDLVNALPALSKDLSEEQKKTLQNNLSYVDQLATRLDKTGDNKDKEGTQTNWQKLQKVLVQLRALYTPVAPN